MRSLAFWTVTAMLVLGAISATVAMVTVTWLYPQGRGQSVASTASATPPAAEPTAPAAAAQPLRTAAPTGLEERAAVEVIRLASIGDLRGALALTAGLTEPQLKAVTGLSPTPVSAAPLPAANGSPAEMLVWTQYRLDGLPARGAYTVAVADGKVTALAGPLAPAGGYARLPWTPLDEQARKVDPATYSARGLILVAPRTPEPGLAETMAQLQREYQARGVDVVLVIDVRSPDWISVARAAGFQGPVWRVKGRLEDVPAVSPGLFLGAVGLLVDREGFVVASLTALDPSRYGLTETVTPSAVAPAVLKAYGLTPP